MPVAVGLYSQGKDRSGLTRRQRQVKQMLKDGKTQQAIAEELGVSRQRIRQIVESLLRNGQELPGQYKPPPEAVTP